MITEAQIKRHLEALQELYTVLDTHTYTALSMTNLRKSYGIQSHTFKAMCEQEYIQKSGANRGAKWKWGPRSEPEPHDARRVIERGLEIKLEKKNAKEPREESKAFRVGSGIDMSGKLPGYRHVYPNPEIVPVQRKKYKKFNQELKKKYVAAELKPSKPLIVEEERKSILWGLFTYTKIKRKG
jgi:hypothetical protein